MTTRAFAEHRGFLVGVAYRILGRVADAEDVVQEAWLRWTRADPAEIRDPRAFLIRVVTRLAIDRLRRIRARREEYVGPWLPEPLLTDSDPSDHVELAESVSIALMVVLEALSPLERAVFVLRDVFDLPYAAVAEVVGRREAAVRQLAARARAHVQDRRPRYRSDPQTRRQVTERFLAACATGDVDALLAVLAPDVTLVADSGGKARAPRVPLHGAPAIARFLRAVTQPETLARFLASIGTAGASGTAGGEEDAAGAFGARIAEVNGGPGILATVGGRVVAVLTVYVADDRVQTIHLVANPEKLARLAPAVGMSHGTGGAAS
jgi:RNA polymerase sigma factor (sigma-70 family)